MNDWSERTWERAQDLADALLRAKDRRACPTCGSVRFGLLTIDDRMAAAEKIWEDIRALPVAKIDELWETWSGSMMRADAEAAERY